LQVGTCSALNVVTLPFDETETQRICITELVSSCSVLTNTSGERGRKQRPLITLPVAQYRGAELLGAGKRIVQRVSQESLRKVQKKCICVAFVDKETAEFDYIDAVLIVRKFFFISATIYFFKSHYLQSVLSTFSKLCVTYTVACRRVLNSAPL
jgi:hypothetical protein